MELVEASASAASIYSDALKEEELLQFHHVGYYIDGADNWRALETWVERHGGPASAGDIPGVLRYLYLDRRADLGHFLEYVQLEEGGLKLFGALPSSRLLSDMLSSSDPDQRGPAA
ncbi:hypothetical protein ACFO3E_15935 [Sphingobium tyrosinilyticum]|uniref:Uncharacterized protein n=1 Tax=Sphingobium tyrosinilyticum TaxID=2715436 RepID=A0ABV9F4D0_9SPHN